VAYEDRVTHSGGDGAPAEEKAPTDEGAPAAEDHAAR
jgi:hypothetical protein